MVFICGWAAVSFRCFSHCLHLQCYLGTWISFISQPLLSIILFYLCPSFICFRLGMKSWQVNPPDTQCWCVIGDIAVVLNQVSN